MGINDIVQHEQTGLLVPIGDETALASALLRLLSDPAERQRFGAAARIYVRSAFGETDIQRQWVEMWRRVSQKETPCIS
jgi:glycosyltransferase involved in cell wall biosynthesis